MGLWGPWAGTTSPQFCVHLGKEGSQESMEPVLWSRPGARAQGALGPIPVLTCKMTFRATLGPFSTSLFLLSRICGVWEGMGVAGVVCAALRGHTRKRSFPPPPAHRSHPRHSVQVEGSFLPMSQKWLGGPEEVGISLSIRRPVLEVGAERVPSGGDCRF